MHGLEDVAHEFAPPAHHRFTQPKIPGHRRNHRALPNADPVTSRRRCQWVVAMSWLNASVGVR